MTPIEEEKKKEPQLDFSFNKKIWFTFSLIVKSVVHFKWNIDSENLPHTKRWFGIYIDLVRESNFDERVVNLEGGGRRLQVLHHQHLEMRVIETHDEGPRRLICHHFAHTQLRSQTHHRDSYIRLFHFLEKGTTSLQKVVSISFHFSGEKIFCQT